MDKRIVFEINEKGDVSQDLIGFEGKGCKKLADDISDLLGGKVISEETKPEYNKNVGNSNTITSGR